MALSLFLLHLPAPVTAHHLVFKQTGEFAGALSHIHVKLLCADYKVQLVKNLSPELQYDAQKSFLQREVFNKSCS
jgi:hypothetical protein